MFQDGFARGADKPLFGEKTVGFFRYFGYVRARIEYCVVRGLWHRESCSSIALWKPTRPRLEFEAIHSAEKGWRKVDTCRLPGVGRLQELPTATDRDSPRIDRHDTLFLTAAALVATDPTLLTELRVCSSSLYHQPLLRTHSSGAYLPWRQAQP